MDCIVHKVAKSRTRLSNFHFHFENHQSEQIIFMGQNIKDKKTDKRIRDGDPSQGGSHKRGEVNKHQETLSLVGLWGFGISEGNITRRKHTHTHTHRLWA